MRVEVHLLFIYVEWNSKFTNKIRLLFKLVKN